MRGIMNPDLYAVLPPNKKEEYKKMFPMPVTITVRKDFGNFGMWYDTEYIIPEKEPIEKLRSIKEIRIDSFSDIKLWSSYPEFGSVYSMHNQKDVCHGLNGEEWLSGARPLPFWGI